MRIVWEVGVYLGSSPVGAGSLGMLLGRGYAAVPVIAILRYVADRLPMRRATVVAAFLLGLWPVLLNELPPVARTP